MGFEEEELSAICLTSYQGDLVLISFVTVDVDLDLVFFRFSNVKLLFSPLSSLFGRKSPWTGPTEGVGVRPHFLVGGDVHTLFGTGAVVPCSESHSGSYHMQNEMETPLRGPT